MISIEEYKAHQASVSRMPFGSRECFALAMECEDRLRDSIITVSRFELIGQQAFFLEEAARLERLGK